VFFELKGDEGTALELCKRHTKKEQIMEISSIEVYGRSGCRKGIIINSSHAELRGDDTTYVTVVCCTPIYVCN